MINPDDLRLAWLMKKGTEGDVVVVGCPFDFFRSRSIHKGGEDNGPCCLRRFIPKVGPVFNSEYQIDMSKVNVSDMGNIKVEVSKEEEEKYKNVKTKRFKGQYINYEKNSPEMIILKISDQISDLMTNNKLPFVFGGSKQSTLGSVRAFYDQQKNQKGTVMMITGKPFLRRPYDGNKGTSDNIVSVLTNEYPEKDFIVFGSHLKHFPPSFVEFSSGKYSIKKQKLKNVHFVLYDEIRKYEVENPSLGKTTSAYFKFVQTFPSKTPVHVTLSLEAIQLFLGCRDLSPMGLSVLQIFEIFMELGKRENLVSIDITEFNPSCEDVESSLLITNFLYYFLMGRASK